MLVLLQLASCLFSLACICIYVIECHIKMDNKKSAHHVAYRFGKNSGILTAYRWGMLTQVSELFSFEVQFHV